jgi:hypothetical protein
MPPADRGMHELDHPILRKARDLAPAFPDNCVRIQEIRGTMVYRFTHGRYRVAAWLEQERGVLWICAADERDEDTYDRFVDLYDHGELLPTEDDALREEVEAAARFVDAVGTEVPRALTRARGKAGEPQSLTLPGGGEVRLLVNAGSEVEEVWVAMPTLNAPRGLTPRMRALVLATLQNELPGGVWEQRYDWPTGRLTDHEVVHMGLA